MRIAPRCFRSILRRSFEKTMILLDPAARPVIGHRGNRAHAPENTLPSLLEAVALGVDAVEFDLHLSRDGMLVVIHDATLERTTDGTGPIALRTLAELRTLDTGTHFTRDAGTTYPWRGRGVTVSTFDEVVEALPRDLPLIVELKTPAASPFLRTAIKRHGIASRVIVAGFDADAVLPLRDNGFAMGATTGEVAAMLLPALLGQKIGPKPFQALCIPPVWNGIPVPILALARGLRGTGVTTHIWTINEPAKALRLWRGGVQGIITDDPGLILAARKALGNAN